MKKNDDYEYKYLRFDNLNFKLAVLQQLIFEKKVFSPTYDFGDFYEEVYDSEDSDYEKLCENYAQRALDYFKYLPIPAEYALDITEINISIDDEIYYEISPEWTGDESFHINQISTREVTQFPKLKYISFSYMSTCVDQLKKQLRPLKIKVFMARNNGEKPISIGISLLSIIIVSLIIGSLGGLVFYQYYKDVEVVFYESTTTEESPNYSKEEDNTETEENDTVTDEAGTVDNGVESSEFKNLYDYLDSIEKNFDSYYKVEGEE